MTTKVSLDYRIDENTLSIGELWMEAAKLTTRRCQDNEVCEGYPFEIRKAQLVSLKALVEAIEQTHNSIETSLFVRKVLKGD